MSKLEDKTLLHGKRDMRPKTLDDIWNVKKKYPYMTKDIGEYTSQIRLMNKTDLFAHAAELGVKPTNPANRTITENKLIAHFKKIQAEYTPVYTKDNHPDEDIANKIKSILTRK